MLVQLVGIERLKTLNLYVDSGNLTAAYIHYVQTICYCL